MHLSSLQVQVTFICDYACELPDSSPSKSVSKVRWIGALRVRGAITKGLTCCCFTTLSTTTDTIRELELELELIQTQMAQKPMLRAEVGMRVRCANKASAD